MNQFLISFLIWSMVLGAAYGQGGDADNMAATIRRQYTDWLKAYEQKDLAGTMAIFAPDAVSTFAGARDNDFNAIRQSYAKSLAAVGPARKLKPVHVESGVASDLRHGL